MQQSGRQSVHRKFLGMTSNTSDCFSNWQNFMVMLTTMTKQIRNKYCCNSIDKSLTFRPCRRQRKCFKVIATTNNRKYQYMAAQTGSTYIFGTMTDSVEIPYFYFRLSESFGGHFL